MSKNIPVNASYFGEIWQRQIPSARAILADLLNNCGKRLDTESLQIIMAEFEATMNSCPLNANTIIDMNGLAPLVPANILTMKSEVPSSFEQLPCMQ